MVVAGLDLTAFLKGPEGRPLDHGHVPIRALHTNFDLLSIHIGSSSNIQRKQMDKNGSYNGSYGTTMVVPGLGNQLLFVRVVIRAAAFRFAFHKRGELLELD